MKRKLVYLFLLSSALSAMSMTQVYADHAVDSTLQITDELPSDSVVSAGAIEVYAIDTSYKEVKCYDDKGTEYTLTIKCDYTFNNEVCAQITNISKDVVCDVVVPETVNINGSSIPIRSVKESAFETAKCTSIVLPKNIREIGNKAFMNCVNLKSVKINGFVDVNLKENITDVDSVVSTTIGDDAFKGCTALTDVYVSGIQTFGDNIFSNCSQLQNVTLTTAGMSGYNFTKSDNDELPMTLGKNTFENCTSLKEFNFPVNLTSVDIGTFNGCTSLQKVTIDSSLTSDLSYDNFTDCNNMASIVVSPSNADLVSIDDCLYRQSYSNITSLLYCPPKSSTTTLNLPDTVTAVKNFAAYKHNNLQKITMDSSKSISIGDSAFEQLPKLTDVDLNAKVTIGKNCFKDCPNLKNVTHSNNEGSIGVTAFENCKNLLNFDFKGWEMIGEAAFRNCTSLKSIIAQSTVGTIGAYCFEGCTALRDVDLQDVAKGVPRQCTFNMYIFKDCTNLESAVLPELLQGVSSGTFQNCTSLKTVKMFENTGTIESSAFDQCKSLTDINLPKFLVLIESNAFVNCQSLKSIDLTRSVISIDKAAFVNCPNINFGVVSGSRGEEFVTNQKYKSHTIPDEITDDQFLIVTGGAITGYRGGFESLTIPDTFLKEHGLTEMSLGSDKDNWINNPLAGYRCSMKGYLKYLDLGPVTEVAKSTLSGVAAEYIDFGNVSVIGENACGGAYNLKTVVLSDNIEIIPKSCFNGCSSLLAFDTPYTCRTIEEGAFRGCKSLQSLTFSPLTETIGKSAFENCAALTTVTLQHNTYLSENVFRGCKAINRIIIPQTVNVAISNTPFVDTYDATIICVKNSKGEDYAKAFNDPKTYENLFPSASKAQSYIGKYNYTIEYREFVDGVDYVSIKGKLTIPEGVTVTRNGKTLSNNNFVLTGDELVITVASNSNNKTFYVNGTEMKSGATYTVKENEDVTILFDLVTLMYGDANADNILTAADAAMILQKVLKNSYQMPVEELTSSWMDYTDVTNDDVLTAADAATVLQKVLKNSYKMPVEL